MSDPLNIYNFSGLDFDMESNCMTIKGVQLADVLNEYSVEEIVDALVATDKHADVLDEIIKRGREE